MVGMEVDDSFNTSATQYCYQLMEEGILCKSTHEHFIRVTPPLILQKHQADEIIDKFSKTAKKMNKNAKKTYVKN